MAYEYKKSVVEYGSDAVFAVFFVCVVVTALSGTVLFLSKLPELSAAWSRNLAEPPVCKPAHGDG